MRRGVGYILYSFGIILSLFLVVFFIRLFSERQLDDISPGISCWQDLMKKADVYYVIPRFENKSIALEKEWCTKILRMNKSLELHGVYHTYREFTVLRDEEYLNLGVNDFESCFGFKPERFKAGQLAISWENKNIVEKDMELDGWWNQIFHKVYHCEDSGRFKNWMNDWF